MTFEIFKGDARKELSRLPDNSVDCCITSPPYYGLRDYGNDSQIGLEGTPEQYINDLLEVFSQVYRAMKPTGTLWLNIGDTYNGNKKGNTEVIKNRRVADSSSFQKKIWSGAKQKDLIGIPWMLAFSLRSMGFYLRQDIIWHKPQVMPEPVKDRCVKSHEYVFLMSKSPTYFFDYEAIQEPAVYFNSDSRSGKKNTKTGGKREGIRGVDNTPVIINEMKNKRDVWSVNTAHFEGAHFATFPEELVKPMVLAGCPRGGVVLDPFTGSGTTGVVALMECRNFVGCELNADYHAMAEKRIKGAWEASPSLF